MLLSKTLRRTLLCAGINVNPVAWLCNLGASLEFPGVLNSHCCTVGSRRYDAGMTTSKIAITLPEEQLARVHREVRSGRADSVSGYIARVLAEQERRESLRELVRDLVAQHGEPKPEDIKWAKRVLAPRGRE